MLDSANIKEIQQIKDLGMLGGLTTNPIIIKRGLNEMGYTGNFSELAKRILEVTEDKPVFFQVVAQKHRELVEQAEHIYKCLKPYGNPYIKIPINTSLVDGDGIYEGVKAIRELKSKCIPTLATAIVTPPQAFIASLAGADYAVLMLRPYDNIIANALKIDLDEEGYLSNDSINKKMNTENLSLPQTFYLSGLDTLKRTSKIFHKNNLTTKLIIAGIRNPVQFSSVLEKGIDVVTLPYKVFIALFSNEGTRKFVNDTYKEVPESYKKFIRGSECGR
jgi:transaldolase